jgi:hypothetical protein
MKREKKTAQAAGASPAGRPNEKERKREGAVRPPPASKPQGSPPGGAGKGGTNRDTAAREVVHGVELACYDNLPTQHPIMICLCGKRVDGSDWEDCGAEFDDHLKEAMANEQGRWMSKTRSG